MHDDYIDSLQGSIAARDKKIAKLQAVVDCLPRDRVGRVITFGCVVRVDFPGLGMREIRVNEMRVDSDGVGSVNENPGNWWTRALDCEVVLTAGKD